MITQAVGWIEKRRGSRMGPAVTPKWVRRKPTAKRRFSQRVGGKPGNQNSFSLGSEKVSGVIETFTPLGALKG